MFLNLNLHQDEQILELELILAVCVLVFIALLFLVLTIIKRSRKIQKVKTGKEFQTIIDDLTFKVMFDEVISDEVFETYEKYHLSKLFKKLLVKSLVSLHKSYVGQPKHRIEKFYEISGLCNFSLKKIKSKSWVNQVEGIRDLSKLNYQNAYADILELTNDTKIEVKKEAIIGVVLLKGIEELEKFKDSNLYFDDWMQSNFLYSLKIKQTQLEHINEGLLQSKNESFLLLLARIIELYQLHTQYDLLMEILSIVQKPKIKSDLETIIARLD